MKRLVDLSYRRVLVALAVVGIVGSATQQNARAQTSTTLPGVVAAQPTAPGKIVSCDAVVVDGSFTPQIAFDSSAIVKSSTVTFSFFDKSNASLGKIDLTPPYEKQTLPPGTDTFTCAIAHEVMADGTVFPAASNNNTALVVGGIAGVGLIAALVGHGGSSGSAPAPTTPAPTTPTSTPTPTSSPTVSPSPTATATVKPSPTATATATASASPTVSPTPTPTSTASTTPIATASPTATAAPSATASPTASAAPTATASPTATPTVNPSAPVLSTNPVDINGTNNTGTSTISEQNYSGTFTASGSTCGSGGSPQPNQTPGPIAAISAGPYSSGTTITVTANEAGSCSVTFTDANMLSVTLDITVTTTSIGVNGKKRVASPSRTAPVPKPLPGAAPSVPQKARGTGRLS